ncbi:MULTISPECIES: HIT domain-containing protein [Pyrobaculum]|uniref:Histidine triad (HIT) protein n=2 Tax=Pyrobaculum arsenaticum TaxID=121277 RepID=A4WLA4_PYRAR|nr:HIT domain-containing protein [Pyrobaculum arsenaticum]ABP51171.1 histidine triad (HIT) protein [Pyrobaculum arsenaticum DSM 13514]MCY0891593.1 HIT domain-containing protein [Pyrobaculum arsenaticum]NYR15105.1 HIT domain-containing protein [Pyrobaculum arsenaticum]
MEFKIVYAPWRYRYIKNIKKGECFLCKAVAEPSRDDENLIPLRGRHVFLILNKYPYTWGHVMVAPYRHISRFEELTDDEWVEMVAFAKKVMDAVAALTGAQDFVIGINVGRAAGAGLEDHIHLHIIPKDTEVKVEDLETALVQLTRDLRKALR